MLKERNKIFLGEDRWLCTLMVQAGWRLEYSAAAEDSTFCPDNFDEFFKQRAPLDSIHSCQSHTSDKRMEANSQQQRLHFISIHSVPGINGFFNNYQVC